MTSSTKKATILAVDDTPENLDVVRGLLSDEYIVNRVKVGFDGFFKYPGSLFFVAQIKIGHGHVLLAIQIIRVNCEAVLKGIDGLVEVS